MEDTQKLPGIKKGAPSVTNGRQPEPRFEVMQITPELAIDWLDSNTHNRPIKQRSVKQYAGAIRRGEWKVNGDAIRFDYNGVLIDGQNRLLAIVEAELPITTLVGFGLEPDSQNTMDMGVRRSLADALKLRKESNVTHLATTIRWAFMWERYITSNINLDTRIDTPTMQQLLTFFEGRRSRVISAVDEGRRINNKFKATPKSMASVAWYIFHELNWEDCQDFFYKLGLGASLTEDSPIFALRRWLLNNADRRDKAQHIVVLALYVKAWNNYRDGSITTNLRWVGGGSAPERFPVAR